MHRCSIYNFEQFWPPIWPFTTFWTEIYSTIMSWWWCEKGESRDPISKRFVGKGTIWIPTRVSTIGNILILIPLDQREKIAEKKASNAKIVKNVNKSMFFVNNFNVKITIFIDERLLNDLSVPWFIRYQTIPIHRHKTLAMLLMMTSIS